jgi:hypothetical protein
MKLPRIVSPETLDGLVEDDPNAIRSRKDLQRVHRIMGTRAILHRTLTDLFSSRSSTSRPRILELGGGDGTLMLRVAQGLCSPARGVEFALLDRQDVVQQGTVEEYTKLGWEVRTEVMDVLDWIDISPLKQRTDASSHWDLIVATLFLHHFKDEQIAALFRTIAETCNLFFAIEPRRSWVALTGSHIIGALGVNSVTRQDAVLSVHAGFRDAELERLWPLLGSEWRVKDYAAGLFSHAFYAERL